MTTRPEPMAGTQSVLRALALLDAFTDDQPTWTATDLAEAISLNRTTTYRLLTALESMELVVRDPDSETYRLGSGLIALGSRAQRANSVREIGRIELEQLADGTGETATLEIPSGAEMVIIEEIPGEFVTSGSQHIGSRWPIYATSTGKAILSLATPEELAGLLPESWPAVTPRTITTREALRADLAGSVRRGYAVAAEELELGFIAVGAPVRSVTGEPVAAISVGATVVRMSPERIDEIGRMVRQAAARISHQLGYRAGPSPRQSRRREVLTHEP